MTTCPDCGVVIHDNILHLCLAGPRHSAGAPATKLEVRGPVLNDTADSVGGLTIALEPANFGPACVTPPVIMFGASDTADAAELKVGCAGHIGCDTIIIPSGLQLTPSPTK